LGDKTVIQKDCGPVHADRRSEPQVSSVGAKFVRLNVDEIPAHTGIFPGIKEIGVGFQIGQEGGAVLKIMGDDHP